MASACGGVTFSCGLSEKSHSYHDFHFNFQATVVNLNTEKYSLAVICSVLHHYPQIGRNSRSNPPPGRRRVAILRSRLALRSFVQCDCYVSCRRQPTSGIVMGGIHSAGSYGPYGGSMIVPIYHMSVKS